MKHRYVLVLLLLLVTRAHAGDVVVFAAASLTDALTEVGVAYAKKSGDQPHFSFASSSVLAKQIMAGAPADLYVSANVGWMDQVQQSGKLDQATRLDLLANQLALIAPANSKLSKIAIKAHFPLLQLLSEGRLAVANPEHVPAGIYAKQALQSLGVWDALSGRLVRGSNVRVTLNYVANGGVPLGIVYVTDAALATKVKLLGVFPASSHDAIVYPAALTQQGSSNSSARDFLRFMASPIAAHIFARYGFKPLIE